jgi:hypothetical protein
VGFETAGSKLFHNLHEAQHVTDGRAWLDDGVDPTVHAAALRAIACGCRIDRVKERRAQRYIHELDAGAHQVVEQQIALRRRILSDPAEHQMAAQSEPRAGGCRLPAVIRLHAGTPHEHFCTLGQGMGQQMLIVAGLVASAGQAGAVVAFDEHARTQCGTQPRCLVQRSRQVR